MKLHDWLCEGAYDVSASLAEINQALHLDSKVYSQTTRTQVIDILNRMRSLILPGLFDNVPVDQETLSSALQNKIKHVAIDLCEVIAGVLGEESAKSDMHCDSKAERITASILEGLPDIRKTLDTDIQAAYEGDPAAQSLDEIILSYPSLEAISIYRIAHLICRFGVPTIPRIMTEYAHKNTGIDIHPGASIGDSFFIDHGTGVVIGETCSIGNGVKLYQGVTLGAKSFPLDENGNPIKNIKRHPDIGNNVIIYAGATILGGETQIGHDSVIGGNVWLTQSVPPFSTVFNAQPSPIIKNAGRE